ncbi:MAG: FAD-dependent thymidylate synthase [Alphaproteobacteria bacterium]
MSLTKEQLAQIEEQRAQSFATKRVTVAAAEDVLYKPFYVLDHGFVRLIDYMGDDSAITQAARVSYGKGTKTVNTDAGLIRYLLRHRHTTPFEMVEAKFHMKMPIFVARQWIRHRTANVNEYSARYSILDKEYYIPTEDALGVQSTQNHQGRGDVLTGNEAHEVLQILKDDAERTYSNYEYMMNEDANGNIKDESRKGLARELARMNLTLNTYTQWYWKIDLHNLLHFLSLRADSHAQYEIRVYAEAMLNIIKEWLPITYKAFHDYRVGGLNLSAQQLALVKRLIKGENVTAEDSGMSKREYTELLKGLDLD